MYKTINQLVFFHLKKFSFPAILVGAEFESVVYWSSSICLSWIFHFRDSVNYMVIVKTQRGHVLFWETSRQASLLLPL